MAEPESQRLAWGILGAGRIARAFAAALTQSRTGRLVAVACRGPGRAAALTAEFGVSRAYDGYAGLLADDAVQAVYVATPHPMHAEWAIRAAEAGKHVLCEKPLTVNHAEAMAVVDAARRAGVFLMEAFMYRCHPQTARLVELVRAGAVGEVRLIEAAFGFAAPFDPDGRIYNNDLGGGGILDVGCYCTSMARLIAGAAAGRPFAEPIDVAGAARLAPTGVDEYAAAVMRFPGDVVALLSTAVGVRLENTVRITGTGGHIVVPEPWAPCRDGGTSRLWLHRHDAAPEEILIRADRPLFAIEADTVAGHLARREAPPPAMGWDDTLGNMRTLDRWRQAIGLVYELEKPARQLRPVHGRPLTRAADAPMACAALPGLKTPLSRIVMGVDHQTSMPQAAVLFDACFEAGCNAFDTAHIYRYGDCERCLGWWIRNRGVRDQVVIIDKGAHTPWCNPADLARQLDESLQRLQTDWIDLYLLHRDNPQVPVGEFIDALNAHRRAGRIRAFGASNWTPARFDEANEYARAAGLEGFCALSNQFSLARMIAPPWEGCLSAGDEPTCAWLAQRGVPLLAWSSQAGGFFAADQAWEQRASARCWLSPENLLRRQRAQEWGRRHGVSATCAALAYVLNRPFATWAIIGPRTLAELRDSLPAVGLQVSQADAAWLEGRD